MPTVDVNGTLIDFPDTLSDDELNRAVSRAAGQIGGKRGVAERITSIVSPPPVRPPSRTPAEFVGRLGRATLETFAPPTSREAMARLMSPAPGQYGISRILQEEGERLPPAQESVGRAAEMASESGIGRRFPGATAGVGATGYALSHLLPPKPTPYEAGIAIGGEAAGPAVGVLRRPVAAVGRGVARAAEAVSGLEYKTPGVLEAAVKDPTLLFGKGRKAAGAAYESIKAAERVRPSIGREPSTEKIIREAIQAADDKTLTPQEALVAREAVDKARKSMPTRTFVELRAIFDDVAKTISSQADKEYARAIMSEALRLPLPVNLSGRTSIGKSFLGTLAGVGPLVAMSPLAQGTAATAAGVAGRQLFGRQIPGVRAALANALANLSRRKPNGR